MADFLYLYGFVPNGTQPPTDLLGIHDSVVKLLPVAQLQAVVSNVPASIYAPDMLEARLQDLPWVAEQGVAHERVVAWFVDHAQILPVAMLTMYSSPDALRSAVTDQQETLLATMRRLQGLREWDLKISFDERALAQNAPRVSEKIAELDREIAQAPAGKGYLLQKKRADMLKSEVRHAAHQKAIEVLDRARARVAEVRNLPLPRAADALPVVLHAALLVPQEREQDLVNELTAQGSELRAVGMDLTFSGPWAPYRFIADHEQ